MKIWPIFRTFFVIIGIAATILIVTAALGYVYFFRSGDVKNFPIANSATTQPYDHPLLTPEQEGVVQSLGVDLRALPTQITAAQEQCAVAALGAGRVAAIKGGAALTMNDYLQAKHCF